MLDLKALLTKILQRLNNIGDVKSHIPDAISCATGRYYQAAYLTLEAGVWLIDMQGLFPPTNTTGIRDIRCTIATSGYNNVTTAPPTYANITINRYVGANINQYVSSHFPVRISETTTFRLIVEQNSGSTMSVTGRMYATRLR